MTQRPRTEEVKEGVENENRAKQYVQIRCDEADAHSSNSSHAHPSVTLP